MNRARKIAIIAAVCVILIDEDEKDQKAKRSKRKPKLLLPPQAEQSPIDISSWLSTIPSPPRNKRSMADSRDRSASPSRAHQAKKQKTSGFKWKEKKADTSAQDARDSGRLERGYRDRDTNDRRRRDDREEERSKRDSKTDDSARSGDPLDRPSSDKRDRPSNDIASKFGSKAGEKAKSSDSANKDKKPKATAPVSNEPMIIVNVNDRLGTKAAIPCLASDSIKNFKAMVAAHIGRQPHEIMLKRQGERPFKDVLTLEDYGVSNGVQLDLELDTGD